MVKDIGYNDAQCIKYNFLYFLIYMRIISGQEAAGMMDEIDRRRWGEDKW